MEKNGAISNQTPRPCCSGGRCAPRLPRGSVKRAQEEPPTEVVFPTTTAEADSLDSDLSKTAAEVVAKASTVPSKP